MHKRDGDILVSVATMPEIYLISTYHIFKPVKLATIPGVEIALSIIETHVDEFYAVVGNFSVMATRSESGG